MMPQPRHEPDAQDEIPEQQQLHAISIDNQHEPVSPTSLYSRTQYGCSTSPFLRK
jgi:hypothetical protein